MYVCMNVPPSLPTYLSLSCTFGWGLLNTPTAPLQRGNTPHNGCPAYDTKQSEGDVQVILELWGMRSTPSSLPGRLWPGVVAPDRFLSMG